MLLKCYVQNLNILSVMQSNSSFTDHFHIWEFILATTTKLFSTSWWAHSTTDIVLAMNYPKEVITRCFWIAINIAYASLPIFSRHILCGSPKHFTFILIQKPLKNFFQFFKVSYILSFPAKVLKLLGLSHVGVTCVNFIPFQGNLLNKLYNNFLSLNYKICSLQEIMAHTVLECRKGRDISYQE